MGSPPSGTVALLFTDIESSTRLWERDPAVMDELVRRHDATVRAVIDRYEGHVFSTAGDSFAVAFATALDAVFAAVELQRALSGVGVGVRMGVHIGETFERDGNYFGPTSNRAARLMHAAHGGQVLVSGATAELVRDRVSLRDLGEHRLRDVVLPMHVWQVVAPGLEVDFPALATGEQGRSNLERPRTELIGREDEAELVSSALVAGRLVTLVGPGGMGETHLAAHVGAAVLARFADGVWLASLSTVEGSDAVADAVLMAVGGRRQPAMSALEALDGFVTDRQLLVILDNCEHVLDGAMACVERVLKVGASAVLATSREPLGRSGERVIAVGPLPRARRRRLADGASH